MGALPRKLLLQVSSGQLPTQSRKVSGPLGGTPDLYFQEVNTKDGIQMHTSHLDPFIDAGYYNQN